MDDLGQPSSYLALQQIEAKLKRAWDVISGKRP